ncbi:DUF6875 domain-containing protein [Streptomyces sp. G-G2]|uniref:DUF6875 domain-containing protein n=1 Tax=Streptomyces sp. G-G2 TaxID=3046201 RepID=UPI0024BADC51|nr:hypothetical protein [Streptomyces sp. G-G2]MDJ0383055.1 hypothetical protein [Streptomyces sp. G-G2]
MAPHDEASAVAVLAPACPASDTERAEAVVQRWLRDYVSRPHGQLGRDGDVCPFVEPAARAGTLMMHTRTGLAHVDGSELRALVRDMARTFRTTHWPRSNPTMYAYVLILPDLPRELWSELDTVQAVLKAELAEAGLMLGQFHPECPEPAARNADFAVSRSPVPLLAMRNMALHDVLFLHNDTRLFAEYQHRFGTRYERGAVADPLLRSSYEAGSAVN